MNSALRSLVALALSIVAVTGFGTQLDRRAKQLDDRESLLYLPNGKHLKVASMGQSSLLADLIYLWAIQYYASYEREDRFQYVEHIFGDVIAQLDPHYTDAYWMGALILIVEGKDLEAGLRLLDLGIANNPADWMLPYLAGWECHHAGDFRRAEQYFGQAESRPGAPDYVARTRIGMAAKGGDLVRAYGLWHQVWQDAESDATTRSIAERQLRHLKVRIDLQEMGKWIERFRMENERWPRALSELLQRGYADALPVDPQGRPYRYDPQSGVVTADDGRILPEES